MTVNLRSVKAWILVIAFSYFGYTFYWVFVRSFPWIVKISLRPDYYYHFRSIRFPWDHYSIFAAYSMEFSTLFRFTIRFIGAFYALLSAYLIWRGEANVFPKVKSKVSKALLLEGLYFLFSIPSILFLLGFYALGFSTIISLSLSYAVKILLVSPFLIALSLKVKKFELGVSEPPALRLAGLSCANYVVALWVGYALRWADMAALEGVKYLFRLPQVVAFLSLACTLPLSVVFAIAGTIPILRKRKTHVVLRWWGLSLIFMSLHFIIYGIYSVTVIGWSFFLLYAALDELWVISMLGLGLYLATKNSKGVSVS